MNMKTITDEDISNSGPVGGHNGGFFVELHDGSWVEYSTDGIRSYFVGSQYSEDDILNLAEELVSELPKPAK